MKIEKGKLTTHLQSKILIPTFRRYF